MIALAILLAQAGSDSPTLPKQEAPAHVIRVGATVQGVLPLRVEAGRNAAEEVYELDPGENSAVTLTLESFDFDALLVVRDPGTGAEQRERGTWRHSNVWLIHEVGGPSSLLLRVAAEDARGGEFVLRALPGRVDPPQGAERRRETLAYCEAVAARAREKNDATRAVQFLGIASQIAYVIEDFGHAKELAERQLEQAREGQLSDEILRAQVNLGGAEVRLGNRDRALELLEGAVEETERTLLSTEDPQRTAQLALLAAFVSDNLGDLAHERGGPAAALPFYRKAVEFLPKARRPDSESTGWCKLGDTLSEMGAVGEARAAIEKGLRLAEGIRRPSVLASALLSQARFLWKQGEPAEACMTCERALGLSAPPLIGLEIQATLANAFMDLGKYEQAESALDVAEARAQELGQDRYAIPFLISRARIAYDLWDLPHARAMLDEALSRQEASGSTLNRVEILTLLGLVLRDEGRTDEAAARYRDALETCETTGQREMQAGVFFSLGSLQEEAGDLAASGASYTQGEEIACEAGSTYLENVARCDRAWNLYLRAQHSESRELASAVVQTLGTWGDQRVVESAQDTLARIGLATGDLAAVDDAVRAADRILAQHSPPPEDRFGAAGMRARTARWGGIVQDLVARRSLAEGLKDSDRNALIRQGWRKAGQWKGRILLEDLQKRLSGRGAQAAHDSSQTVRDEDLVLPRIADRTAIVEYVDGLEKLYAYVSLPQAVRLVDLGEREPIEKRARALVQAMADRSVSPRAFASESSWMYDQLLSKLRSELPPDLATLVIVPTPALAILPFEALVVPGPAASAEELNFADLHYLMDDVSVVYAPSSPVLAELQQRRRTEGNSRFLILGDPLYLAEGQGSPAQGEKVAAARPGSAGFDYGRLKSTQEESLEIARLLLVKDSSAGGAQAAELLKAGAELLKAGSERSTALTSGRFDLYLGSRADRSVLNGDLKGYGCIHIAAHGHVDPEDPRRSGLLLSYDPETRGLFTLEDVLGLELDADLAVLSACDTARGSIVRGEGVQSLACGFLRAGARSVVASLWKVDDPHTSRIMRSFYAAYVERGLHPAQALSLAKLEFRSSREERGPGRGSAESAQAMAPSNPYFWAPFVYVGAGPE